jgi:transmembrane sensor
LPHPEGGVYIQPPMSELKARDEASQWLARITRGLSDEDGRDLREWLKNTRNRAELMEAAQFWHDDVRAVISHLFPKPPSPPAPRAGRTHLASSLPMLASLSIVVLGTFMLMGTMPWAYLGEKRVVAPATTTSMYTTAAGERREVKLADSSTITLNTRTKMTVVYSQNARSVHLQYGEASFEVAADPSRPFNVRAGKREFQALGTRFMVRVLNPEHVELTVTEGEVKVVYAPPVLPDTPARRRENLSFGEATLTAGETAMVEPGFQSVRMLVAGELEAREAWQRDIVLRPHQNL